MRFRILLFSLVALAFSPPGFIPEIEAQSLAKTFTLNAANQNACIGTSGLPTIGIQVSGTFSATLQPQVAIKGQTAQNSQVTPTSSTTAQSTITTTGTYVAGVGGFDTFCLNVSSYSSGTATVQLNPSPALNASLLGGSGSGAGVASFNTRTGAVVPASGDYTYSQVTDAAGLNNPAPSGFTPEFNCLTIGNGNTGVTHSSTPLFINAQSFDSASGDYKQWGCDDTTTGELYLQLGGTTAANIPNTGDAFNNFSPLAPSTPALYIIGDSNFQHGFIEIHSSGAQFLDAFAHINSLGSGPTLSLYKSRGTQAAPTNVLANDNIGQISASGYDSTTSPFYFVASAAPFIEWHADENWTTGHHGARFDIFTVPDGETSANSDFTFAAQGSLTGDAFISGNNTTSDVFQISGCSATTATGGATAGTFVSGTSGTCTVTVSMGNTGETGRISAPNGWACGHPNDLTTNSDSPSWSETATTASTATLSGTSVSGDVINFACIGY